MGVFPPPLLPVFFLEDDTGGFPRGCCGAQSASGMSEAVHLGVSLFPHPWDLADLTHFPFIMYVRVFSFNVKPTWKSQGTLTQERQQDL